MHTFPQQNTLRGGLTFQNKLNPDLSAWLLLELYEGLILLYRCDCLIISIQGFSSHRFRRPSMCIVHYSPQ